MAFPMQNFRDDFTNTTPAATADTTSAVGTRWDGTAIRSISRAWFQAITSSIVALYAGTALARVKRLFSGGTALVIADVNTASPPAGWGATANRCTAIYGSDQSGDVELTAAGGGYLNPAIFSITFKDLTWTNSPTAVVALKTTSDATARGMPLTWVVTATSLDVTFYHTPVGGATYVFSWVLIGH